MDKQRLVQTAQALVADKKGILAADESGGTIKRRFESINMESTEKTGAITARCCFAPPGFLILSAA